MLLAPGGGNILGAVMPAYLSGTHFRPMPLRQSLSTAPRYVRAATPPLESPDGGDPPENLLS